MISHRVKNLFRTTTAFAAMAAASLAMSSCGGGGGSDEDDSPPTTRVKTMDGITLTLSSSNNFEFTRHAGTPPAALNGSMETGTYTYSRGGPELHKLQNANNNESNILFPDSLNTGGYTYLGQNDGGGVLILTGSGNYDQLLDGGGTFNLLAPITFLFRLTTDDPGVPSTQLRIDLTFTATGTQVNTGIASAKMVESSSPYDDFDAPSNIRLTAGGTVPLNYNPYIDPLRPSKVAPVSLGLKLFRFTHGGGDASKDFTLQFSAEVPGNDTTLEVGSAIQRIGGALGDAPAVNYTWTRIGGTDSGRLVVSEGGNVYDGTYILTFKSDGSGNYVGSPLDVAADPNDVTGKFIFN